MAKIESAEVTMGRLRQARSQLRKAAERMAANDEIRIDVATNIGVYLTNIDYWANMIRSKLCNGCAEKRAERAA